MYQNEIYVAGGERDWTSILQIVEVYNLEGRVWREIQLMKQGRYLPTMAVINGNLSVYGGHGNSSSSMEVYTEEGWVESRMKYNHDGHAGVIIEVSAAVKTTAVLLGGGNGKCFLFSSNPLK